MFNNASKRMSKLRVIFFRIEYRRTLFLTEPHRMILQVEPLRVTFSNDHPRTTFLNESLSHDIFETNPFAPHVFFQTSFYNRRLTSTNTALKIKNSLFISINTVKNSFVQKHQQQVHFILSYHKQIWFSVDYDNRVQLHTRCFLAMSPYREIKRISRMNKSWRVTYRRHLNSLESHA